MKRHRSMKHQVNLENLRAIFSTLEYLIKKREILGCNGMLPRNERRIVYWFDNNFFFAEEIEYVIGKPQSLLAELIRQQSDDIAIGMWRWWYNRQPIVMSVEIEIIVGIYFNVHPGSNLRDKMLFIKEDVLCMDDDNIRYTRRLLRKIYPFLKKLKKPSSKNWESVIGVLNKKYGKIQELKLKWK